MNTLPLIYPDWPAPENVLAYSTCRAGGLSQQPYAALNLAQHVGDEPETVRANRALLPMAKNIVWLDQTHSTTCTQLSFSQQGERNVLNADGSFSLHANLVCAVMTADCLPILLCNRQGTCVVALHGGWRGLAKGIIENALKQLPGDRDQLMAWLGPAISQEYFEVGAEVKRAFPGHDAAFARVKAGSEPEGKFMADIYQIARKILADNGVSAVYGGEHCSYAEAELFFSHRRATHQANASTGRMVSCIGFR